MSGRIVWNKPGSSGGLGLTGWLVRLGSVRGRSKKNWFRHKATTHKKTTPGQSGLPAAQPAEKRPTNPDPQKTHQSKPKPKLAYKISPALQIGQSGPTVTAKLIKNKDTTRTSVLGTYSIQSARR